MKAYQDYYFRKAKAENFPARSVYKLQEIDQKFKVLRPGMHVLDLGAAPGSWSLDASGKVGDKGVVLSCDLKPATARFPANVHFLQADALEPCAQFQAELENLGPFDAVLSDMAPATTGSRVTDQARSLELALSAFAIAGSWLRAGGSFVVKIFMGPDTGELLEPMRQSFRTVKTFKPKSSRSESRETFFVGMGKTG